MDAQKTIGKRQALLAELAINFDVMFDNTRKIEKLLKDPDKPGNKETAREIAAHPIEVGSPVERVVVIQLAPRRISPRDQLPSIFGPKAGIRRCRDDTSLRLQLKSVLDFSRTCTGSLECQQAGGGESPTHPIPPRKRGAVHFSWQDR